VDSQSDRSTLRYIDANCVQSPAGALADVDLCDMNGRPIGSLEGVLVDPVERRLRFYVVDSGSRRGPRHYLLPTEWPAQVASDGKALKIDADSDELAGCDEFRESDVQRFSDDDFIAAMFRPRVA
jgi:hypothetical protein